MVTLYYFRRKKPYNLVGKLEKKKVIINLIKINNQEITIGAKTAQSNRLT